MGQKSLRNGVDNQAENRICSLFQWKKDDEQETIEQRFVGRQFKCELFKINPRSRRSGIFINKMNLLRYIASCHVMSCHSGATLDSVHLLTYVPNKQKITHSHTNTSTSIDLLFQWKWPF